MDSLVKHTRLFPSFLGRGGILEEAEMWIMEKKMSETESASLLCLMIVNCILSNEYHEFVLLPLFSSLVFFLSFLPSRFVSFLHFKNTFLESSREKKLR